MMLAVSVNGALGHAGLLIVLAASVVGALSTGLAIVTGNRAGLRQAPNYAWVIAIGALLSVVAMQVALQQRDYSLKYVQDVGSYTTPWLYNVAAMWSALEGSILLWVAVLAGFTAAVAWRFRKRSADSLVGWAMVVMFVVCAFFALIAFGPANPFAAGPPQPLDFDGRGPNPLLQNHILVMFHPPILYLGYIGFTVPFAFAIAALITGRVGEGWLMETRRWALFSWCFLTIGILLGGWWSYEVLGWSGVWAWDPVENASLLPWLTGTAYIHSVLVQQRRGMLRVWNLSLLVATFALTILGTFLTRSGIVGSVHAFAAGEVDGYLLGFFGVIVVVSLGLIAWRGDRLRSPGVIDSPVSREGAFLANNVVFTVFAVIVLVGTVFPLLVETFEDRQTVVGAPYFDGLAMPIGLVLLFLMAIAPVLPWRKASAELLSQRLFWPAWVGAGTLALAVVVGADGWAPLVAFFLGGFAAGAALRQIVLATRRQGWSGLVGRANGGMVVHLGVILVGVTLVASNAYTETRTVNARVGEPVEVLGHQLELLGVDVVTDAREDRAIAHVRVDGGRVLDPAITTYLRHGMDVPTPGIDTGLTRDLYITIAANNQPSEDAQVVGLQVQHKPLMMWMWVGGLLMAVGTVLAAFPGKRQRNPLDPVSAPVPSRGDETKVVEPVETTGDPEDREVVGV
ncbi:MAG TPA: heme lyase CcmF/NrfE family subunit [Ilumatobacter sp.]|nr:heme lyase CcmF/NrfE family subunit [Ilumatobacter sp.]